MKEYIVLTIGDNTLFFNFRTINEEENKFVNRLEFYNASLFFSLKYRRIPRTKAIPSMLKFNRIF